MSLTIELTPEQEARLTAAARRDGIAPEALAVRLLVENLPEASVPVSNYRADLSIDERIRLMDAFAETNRRLPHLPDEAFDRETLYGEDREFC